MKTRTIINENRYLVNHANHKKNTIMVCLHLCRYVFEKNIRKHKVNVGCHPIFIFTYQIIRICI